MSDGIVPPYLSSEWRHMRRALTTLAESAEDAREASTLEELRIHLGKASAALIDADFWRLRIERKESTK